MDDNTSPAGGNKKRAKPTETSVASQKLVEEEGGGSGVGEEKLEEETGVVITCSEEMEARIGEIFEKMEQFAQQVEEMLEAGRTMFKNLSEEFEGRLFAILREQIYKWEEEITELRLLDASNEEASALLQKARYHLLQNVQMDS